MKLKFDFKRIISYFNLSTERGLSTNPARDWKVLLICSVIFLIFIFAVDVNTLSNVKQETGVDVQGGGGEKELKVNEVMLGDVLNTIDRRAEVFKANSAVYVAPQATTTAF